MQVLLDTNMSFVVRDALIQLGHDAVWIGEDKEDPGDEEILRRTHAEKRILITQDKDFGERAIFKKEPHSGIIRLVNLSLKQHASVCHQILEKYGSELLSGSIVTAEIDRVRIRPPDM